MKNKLRKTKKFLKTIQFLKILNNLKIIQFHKTKKHLKINQYLKILIIMNKILKKYKYLKFNKITQKKTNSWINSNKMNNI